MIVKNTRDVNADHSRQASLYVRTLPLKGTILYMSSEINRRVEIQELRKVPAYSLSGVERQLRPCAISRSSSVTLALPLRCRRIVRASATGGKPLRQPPRAANGTRPSRNSRSPPSVRGRACGEERREEVRWGGVRSVAGWWDVKGEGRGFRGGARVEGRTIARSCVRASVVIARRARGGKHCTVRLAGPEAAGSSVLLSGFLSRR